MDIFQNISQASSWKIFWAGNLCVAWMMDKHGLIHRKVKHSVLKGNTAVLHRYWRFAANSEEAFADGFLVYWYISLKCAQISLDEIVLRYLQLSESEPVSYRCKSYVLLNGIKMWAKFWIWHLPKLIILLGCVNNKLKSPLLCDTKSI
jgi:hypothetical protein